jgi:hypothetical protein
VVWGGKFVGGVLRSGIASPRVPPEPEAHLTLFRIRAASLLEGSGITKRLAVVLLLTLLALVAAAPSALAAKPTHERVPIDDEFVDESYGFPLDVQQTGFLVAIEWVDADGSLRRFEAYPQLKATYTNPSTGETLRVNFSGPGRRGRPVQRPACPRNADDRRLTPAGRSESAAGSHGAATTHGRRAWCSSPNSTALPFGCGVP